MFKSLKELFNLLSEDQRKKLYLLQLLVIFMSLLEVASVMAFGPFMALVGNLEQLEEEGFMTDLFTASGLENSVEFLIAMAFVVLGLLILSAAVSMYTLWVLSVYGEKVGASLSSRLYQYYLNQNWLFHTTNNSSQLTNKISIECKRITDSIINPFMQMNAKLVLVFVMAISILIYNPIVAIVGSAIFSFAYFFIFSRMKSTFEKNATDISNSHNFRFKLMGEGFGGIKDTLLLGRQALFTDSFKSASRVLARALGKNLALSQVPKYAIELMAFGLVIFMVIFLLVDSEGDIGTILSILAVFSLAGLKLLPAFQQIYFSATAMKGNLAAFENLKDDLYASSTNFCETQNDSKQRISLKKEIAMENISFKYPNSDGPALKDISLKISANQVIGIVGPSGSGKSTLLDIFLGLITPSSGKLLIDDKPLNTESSRKWQNNIGFVAQDIFLADTSIRENIAFGLSAKNINNEDLKKATLMAHLDQLLESLPNGLDSTVGERGVQLSGGQRQRIGIARALYNDPGVLIFDEATSSLDGITERVIMDAIHDFSGSKTKIVVAHRLATVKRCDDIYLMDSGTIIDFGSYNDLIKRNKRFKQMTELA